MSQEPYYRTGMSASRRDFAVPAHAEHLSARPSDKGLLDVEPQFDTIQPRVTIVAIKRPF